MLEPKSPFRSRSRLFFVVVVVDVVGCFIPPTITTIVFHNDTLLLVLLVGIPSHFINIILLIITIP